MSYGRSPLFEPQPPPAPKPQTDAKKPMISPIAHYVGEGNMPLVWTMLALVAFVAFVIFYIVYNPLPPSVEYPGESYEAGTKTGATMEYVPPAGTPKRKS